MSNNNTPNNNASSSSIQASSSLLASMGDYQQPPSPSSVPEPRTTFGFYDGGSKSRKAYKADREKYQEEKQRILSRSGYDSSLEITKRGHLKVRNQLRSWVKFYCELRHGMLLMYKDDKPESWQDTVVLSGGVVIERPSRKEGFTFKFSHPLKQSVHAPRGPKGEIFLNLPRVPSDHVIFRVATLEECHEWIHAFKVAIYGPHPNYDDLLAEDDATYGISGPDYPDGDGDDDNEGGSHSRRNSFTRTPSAQLTPSAFNGNQRHHHHLSHQGSTATSLGVALSPSNMLNQSASARGLGLPDISEVAYVSSPASIQRSPGISAQKFELPEEIRTSFSNDCANVPVGARVSIPPQLHDRTPLLQRLGLLFLHSFLLTEASTCDNEEERIALVTKWLLSCFYGKFAGFGIPFLPILGEVYRCKFQSPASATTGTSISFHAEAVAASPLECAIDANHVEGGWHVYGSLFPEVVHLGNTVKYSLKGSLTLSLSDKSESLTVTLPGIRASGVILGNVTAVLAGQAAITSQTSGITSTIDFDAQSLQNNHVHAVLAKSGDSAFLELDGKWDEAIDVSACSLSTYKQGDVFLSLDDTFAASALERQEVAPEHLYSFHSKKYKAPADSQSVWKGVLHAFKTGLVATKFKEVVRAGEQAQSGRVQPHLFRKNGDVWELNASSLVPISPTLAKDDSMHSLGGPQDVSRASQLRRRFRAIGADSYDQNGLTSLSADTLFTDADNFGSAQNPIAMVAGTSGAGSRSQNGAVSSSLEMMNERLLIVERMLARERLIAVTCLVLFFLFHLIG